MGTESGGKVEVWSAATTISKVESFSKKLISDTRQAFPVGRAFGDAAWCTEQTGAGTPLVEWQWKMPDGDAFSVSILQSSTTFYLKLTERKPNWEGYLCA